MESRSGRLAMVAAARRHRRAVGGGDARRQMGRRATGGRAALRPPSPAGRHPHLVGPCRRRRDPANLRHEYDHTGAHRPRPRPPLSGRQGRRGHRCARPRDGPQAGRCRDARRTLPGKPRHPKCSYRIGSGGSRCRVTSRDVAASATHPSGLSKTTDPDPGLRRVRPAGRGYRYGLGRNQGRRGLRGRPSPPTAERSTRTSSVPKR